MLHSTNSNKVERLNEIAGNESGVASWKDLENQFKYINSEFLELKKAIAERHVIDTVDAACDVLVTVYGLLSRMGVNADLAMVEIAAALETRFDSTMEDALKTKAKYEALNVETYIHTQPYEGRSYFITRSSKDQVGNNGEQYSTGKWLKSYKFREPHLGPVIQDSVFERLGYPAIIDPDNIQTC